MNKKQKDNTIVLSGGCHGKPDYKKRSAGTFERAQSGTVSYFTWAYSGRRNAVVRTGVRIGCRGGFLGNNRTAT